ncbi:hypothetical protein EJ04DRAFT_213096 [Polyplosphaeria fusca]|uniref:Uncharacterized protein n=1 Tax=Polyplosphaeria fusca TaxID=682080 RepID=A0A9P4V9H2_9PLEO|nr:hypothetical protein EJ04DRAFT_213096 [Polyplosphaeria fusca]
MTPDTLPPYRHISSTPISLGDASALLTTYLTNSESHAHLHPDALITPTGVEFSSHGGASGGVVIHNLRRVAAGLRGEYLEPEKTPEPETQDQTNAWGDEGAHKKKKKGRRATDSAAATANEGWQDMSEYEREQAAEVGEIGPRDTLVAEGQEAVEHEEVYATVGAQEEDGDVEGGKKRKKTSDEKEARKKAKKEKEKQRKRDKESKRAKGDE